MSRMKRFTAALAVGASMALALAGCGSNEPESTFDPDAPVTLNLAFWGNDSRAKMYDDALKIFTDEHPNFTINSTFLGFPEFWDKRNIEAAGGNLPDVMQFDYSYLRQYSENGHLLDLGPYLGKYIQTGGFSESALSIGVVDDKTMALPIGTNAWAMFLNKTLLDQVSVEAYPGNTSGEDYVAWMASITQQGGGALWGGSDPTGRIQNFEIQMRADGKDLFTVDGQPQFTEADLKSFWEQGAALRASGAVIPTQRVLEVAPKSGFGANLTASELTWDNFGAAYAGDIGTTPDTLDIVAPPTTKSGSKDLYLKPSMLHAIAKTTQHPEASAMLVDFLLNNESAGKIFGTNRGLPASTTQLAGVELDPLSQKILDYEASIASRLGSAPPVPIVGYGTIEEKFRVLGEDLGLGTVNVDEAVSQFFDELDVILNQ